LGLCLFTCFPSAEPANPLWFSAKVSMGEEVALPGGARSVASHTVPLRLSRPDSPKGDGRRESPPPPIMGGKRSALLRRGHCTGHSALNWTAHQATKYRLATQVRSQLTLCGLARRFLWGKKWPCLAELEVALPLPCPFTGGCPTSSE
jgi:hypothetical protein